MPTKRTTFRLAGTAIAAVLALTATPAFAQETDPLAPTTESSSVPPETAMPVTDTAPAPASVSDPLAPDSAEAAPTSASTEAAPAKKASTATAKRTAARTAAPRTAAPAPAPVASAVEPVDTLVAPLASDEVLPVPPMAAEPMPVEPVQPASQLAIDDDVLPIAAGAGLGLLLLGGAAAGLRRRRRKAAVAEWQAEPANEPRLARPVHREPVAPRPAPVPAREFAPVAASSDSSHVERALAGPTPENPFLSLKKRLKRAAFFDQRDRAVAAGRAEPVPATAGLPERLVRALTPKPAATAPIRSGMRFGGYRYQPA